MKAEKNHTTQKPGHISTYRGIKILEPGQEDVKRLRRTHYFIDHGNKIWPTTYGLMDYFSKNPVKSGTRTLEIGCGWGILSIYLQKKFNARPTCTDRDENVFRYLELHEKYNGANIKKKVLEIEKITVDMLSGFDLMLGVDICYHDPMVKILFNLIKRSRRSRLREIIIADPMRAPYIDLVKKIVGVRFANITVFNADRYSLLHIRL